MSDNSSSSGFSWFLAGLGIGSLIGVLYAPKPGSETREELVAGALGRTEYLKQRSREVSGQVNEYVNQGKGKVNDYVARGREYVDASRERLGGVVDQAQHLVNEHTAKAQAAIEAGKQAYVETHAPSQPVSE